NAPQVMRFQIPITVSSQEIDELLRRIGRAVRRMRAYLAVLLPLARIPAVRMLLDNIHLQIFAFNVVRDIEEIVLRIMPGKEGV
ncbi:MAG TPA: hypothetical protein PLW83_08455, partial [Deltaproteobacteria bacterium]|nr:hypothetical protein [Deltaproteobacteria bacterium]